MFIVLDILIYLFENICIFLDQLGNVLTYCFVFIG